MAKGQLSEKELGRVILMQSMFAAKNIRSQRDRVLEFQTDLQQISGDPIQLQQTPGDPIEDEEVLPGFDEVAMREGVREFELLLPQPGDPIQELVSGLDEVCSGLTFAARYLTRCLDRAAKNGARLAPNPSFSDLDQLFNALRAAQRLPARPTTQTEAFSRIQAALYAVKLTQEHHLKLCIGLLSPTHPAPAATRRPAGGSMEDTRICLDGACTMLNVAVEHIDLAIAAISPLVHPNEVAGNARFAETYTDIGWDALTVMVRRQLNPKR